MPQEFNPHAPSVPGSLPAPLSDLGPGAHLTRRRFVGGLLAGAGGLMLAGALPSAWAREGVELGPPSNFSKMVSAPELENTANLQYGQLKQQASRQRALVSDDDPQVVRLRTIARRLIPFSHEWNPRARDWKWEINLIASDEVNAFCMPGGKIAFFTGLLEQLQLSDDEVAVVMGHEIAHALREHIRAQQGKSKAVQGGEDDMTSLLGKGKGGRHDLLSESSESTQQLLALRFSRDDETEADLLGMELAARGGYDPQAAVTMLEKLSALSQGGGGRMQILQSHPLGPTRVRDVRASLPKVAGLYARAPKPDRKFGPPPKG